MSGQYTFSRAERLTRKSDFRTVFKRGEKQVGPYFVCYLVRRETQGCKLGLAVSRKVGNAVVRNRIKRYIREYYRTHRPQFPKGVQLMVVARPASATLSYQGCADALTRLLRRGGLVDD